MVEIDDRGKHDDIVKRYAAGKKPDNKQHKIGIGMVTYNRPKYFGQSSKSVVRQLLSSTDRFVVYNDGSDKNYDRQYKWLNAVKSDKIQIIDSKENHGVAHAKNQLFRELMKDCDYIFIIEDDIIPQNSGAITMYMAANRMTGIDHMLFAYHGPGNRQEDSLIQIDGPLAIYKACVGAWCFYTRDILEKVGLMDENFHNAWEHVEHSWRIAQYHNIPYGYWPDVIASWKHLVEIPGSIDGSSIGTQQDPKRLRVIIDGLEYWKKKDGKIYPAQHTLDYFVNCLKQVEEGI